MLGMIFWVAFGMAIGWTAAILRGARRLTDISGFIVMGGLGGLAGGFIGTALAPASPGYRTAATDIMFAVFGSTAFVVIAGLIHGFITQRRSE